MPELPEVEYTARQLRAEVVGATISRAHLFWPRTIGYPVAPDFLVQIGERRIESVRRRAKFLILDLSGEMFLSVHRRMSGNLLLLAPGWEIDTHLQEENPAVWSVKGPIFRAPSLDTSDKQMYERESHYCRVCFDFQDGRRLLFTDPRKFGRIELWPRTREKEAFADLGPEPLSADFTVEGFAVKLAARRVSSKQALLDQRVVAGVGNIYADEALFYAGIHPLRRADHLTFVEIEKLHKGVITVLTAGIEHGGTSFSLYRDLKGEVGDHFNHVLVYQQDGKPCSRCGTVIERIVVAQRSAHFCGTCQRLTIAE